MAIPKNVFLGLIYKFPFTGITALRLCVLTSKNIRLYALTHQRNLSCLPGQKRFSCYIMELNMGIIVPINRNLHTSFKSTLSPFRVVHFKLSL